MGWIKVEDHMWNYEVSKIEVVENIWIIKKSIVIK